MEQNTVTLTLTRTEAAKVLAFLGGDLSTTGIQGEVTSSPKAKSVSKAKPDTKKEVKKETPPKEEAPKEEKVPKEEAPKEEKAADITLDQLKTLAKEAVARTDRETVKKTIARYGQKLAAVTENNYGSLASDLEAL